MRCTWMCFAGLHLLFPCCLDLFLTAGFPFLFTFQQGLEPVRPWRQRGVGRDRKKLVAQQFRSVNYYNFPRHDSFCRKVRRNPEDLSFAEKKADFRRSPRFHMEISDGDRDRTNDPAWFL